MSVVLDTDVYLEVLWSHIRLSCFSRHLLTEIQIIIQVLMWVVVLICSQSRVTTAAEEKQQIHSALIDVSDID